MQFEVTLLKPLKYLQTSLFPPGHATTQKPIFATRGFTGKKMVLLRISQAVNTGNALGSCLFTYTTWAENIRSKPKWFTPWERCSTAPAGHPAAGISQLALSLVLVSLTTMGGGGKGGGCGGKENQFLTEVSKNLTLNTELTVGQKVKFTSLLHSDHVWDSGRSLGRTWSFDTSNSKVH